MTLSLHFSELLFVIKEGERERGKKKKKEKGRKGKEGEIGPVWPGLQRRCASRTAIVMVLMFVSP